MISHHNNVGPITNSILVKLILGSDSVGKTILSPDPCLEFAKEGNKIMQQKLPEEQEGSSFPALRHS